MSHEMTIAENQQRRLERCRIYSHNYRKVNRVLVNARARKRYEKDPGITKRRNILRRYGITLEQYEQILCAQNGECRICRKSKEKMCLDHCHVTGKIRGILCNECNIAIGALKDSPALVARALEYLLP